MTSNERQGGRVPAARTDAPEKRPRYREITPQRWLDVPTLRMTPPERARAEAVARRQICDMTSADVRRSEREERAAAEVRERGAGRAA